MIPTVSPNPCGLPNPCGMCGWQYPQDTLNAAARGEVVLDPLPTHLCY